jgi:hypothetical protein
MNTIRNPERTIANAWQRFEAVCVGRGALPDQLQEMRQSFYGGAAAVLGVMTEISANDVSDMAGVHILEGLHQELRAFAVELKALAAQMRAHGRR